MKKLILSIAIVASFMAVFTSTARDLPVKWEELLASDWDEALEKSGYTCILPMGVLEKHGPHAPLGSDIIHAREWALRAANMEYAVVFPEFIYGQVYEAMHQPGTFTIPSDLMWSLLQATVDEIARNGFKRILILNGHGGNNNFIRYFLQAQLEKQRDFAVYLHTPATDPELNRKVMELRKSDPSYDGHAGERETSTLLYLRPDLVVIERADDESGKNQTRLELDNLYTGIWWYASYPNHYAGEGSVGSRELGKLITDHYVESIARNLKVIKNDEQTLRLQDEFYERIGKGFRED
jgi:creatinine amidohydrolase